MRERNALSKLKPYVPGKKHSGTVKLSSNENPLGPSPRARNALFNIADSLHRYPDKEATGLREGIARLYDVEPDQVIVGNGSDEIMTMIAGTFLNPGEESITAAHTFSQYTFATLLFDGTLTYAPMDDARFDLEAMLQRLSSKTRIVFLCNPNNPTSTYFSHDELVAFLDRVPSEVLVVLDEAYAEYADAEDFPDSYALLPRYPNLLVLRTFSKIYGLAGLRIGYGIGAPELIASLEKVRQPFNVSLAAQYAGEAALEDWEFVQQSRELTLAGKAYLYEKLKELGIRHYASQTNFLFIQVPEGETADRFVPRVAEGGATVRPLTSFGLPEWIRVTVGTEEDNQQFLQALRHALQYEAQHGQPGT